MQANGRITRSLDERHTIRPPALLRGNVGIGRTTMFGVVTKVNLPEGSTIDEGRRELESQVIPMLKQAPGFVSAVFLSPPSGREGLSVIVFETKEQAEMATQMRQFPEGITLISDEIREVAASA
jgi:hypothetical protein